MRTPQLICPMEPVMYTCMQSQKRMGGSGSVWTEVPKGTTMKTLGAYVITKEALKEAQRKALECFLEDVLGKCPSCFSINVELYPDSNGICYCNGCNDKIPPDLEDPEEMDNA